jgi:hypothetical protein
VIAALFQKQCPDLIDPEVNAALIKFVDFMSTKVDQHKQVLASINQIQISNKMGKENWCAWNWSQIIAGKLPLISELPIR